MSMHKLLARQLKRYFGETEKVPADLDRFIQAVDEAYQHFDEDRTMIDRSLELSSKELNSLNQRLEGEVAKQVKRSVELESLNLRLASEKERAEGILRYLRSIGEGVYATDQRGTVIFVNDAALELLGYMPDKTVGSDSRELFRFSLGIEESAPLLLTTELALRAELAQGFPRGTFLFRNGQPPLPVTGTFAPIMESGEITGAIVVFQDITERYELEKMKENFLAIAAHQLRTPLGSMRWSMELLKNGDLGAVSATAQLALAQLYENSSRMLTIVNDLLNVSRINQGRTGEEAERVNIAELLNSVVTAMRGAIEEKKLQLHWHEPKEPMPSLFVTKKHLFEVFENIVANAICYSRDHGAIDISLKKEKEWIVVSIADTGIGIPEEDQPKIFSKFFRAGNAIQHFTDGTGLGLVVVKSYVEENGGTVSFASEKDKGTTFTVRLPVEPKKSVILS